MRELVHGALDTLGYVNSIHRGMARRMIVVLQALLEREDSYRLSGTDQDGALRGLFVLAYAIDEDLSHHQDDIAREPNQVNERPRFGLLAPQLSEPNGVEISGAHVYLDDWISDALPDFGFTPALDQISGASTTSRGNVTDNAFHEDFSSGSTDVYRDVGNGKMDSDKMDNIHDQLWCRLFPQNPGHRLNN